MTEFPDTIHYSNVKCRFQLLSMVDFACDDPTRMLSQPGGSDSVILTQNCLSFSGGILSSPTKACTCSRWPLVALRARRDTWNPRPHLETVSPNYRYVLLSFTKSRLRCKSGVYAGCQQIGFQVLFTPHQKWEIWRIPAALLPSCYMVTIALYL